MPVTKTYEQECFLTAVQHVPQGDIHVLMTHLPENVNTNALNRLFPVNDLIGAESRHNISAPNKLICSPQLAYVNCHLVYSVILGYYGVILGYCYHDVVALGHLPFCAGCGLNNVLLGKHIHQFQPLFSPYSAPIQPLFSSYSAPNQHIVEFSSILEIPCQCIYKFCNI